MAICPADFKPCVNDICYGGGCLKCGESMLDYCRGGCGQLIAIDGSDRENCECDDEPNDDWEDGE